MYMYFLFEKTQNNYIQTKTTIKQQQKIDAGRLEPDAYDCYLEDHELALLAPIHPLLSSGLSILYRFREGCG